MKKILITGSLGQLGKALKKELSSKKKYQLYMCDYIYPLSNICGFYRCDITNFEESNTLINNIRPDIIINCAAQTKVDIDESEYEETYNINVMGVYNLIKISNKINSKLIHISTDYVFDGNKRTPYIETDEKNPLNYYGKTKSKSEELIFSLSKDNIVIRTAWMYGEGRNFVNTIIKASEKNKELNVVSDQYGTPTSAISVAKCISYLIENDCKGKIYHATCEGSTNWYYFTKTIFEILKKEVKINPISSEEYISIAKRPKYSVLENMNLKKIGYNFLFWEEELYNYLKENYSNYIN